jgi:peptidoglycan/xylan/chitin deacetylase (PgdA/CDA1 family)
LKNNRRQALVLELKKLNIGDLKKIDEIAEIFDLDFDLLTRKFSPYLSLEALKKLHDDGFWIGSHGFDHAEFQDLPIDLMKKQIEESFAWLETHLKIGKRIFSFPFTDHNIPIAFFEYLKNEAGVVVSFGTAGLKSDTASGNIQRIPVELEGFNSIHRVLKAEYFYYLAKMPFNKNLIIRK